MYPPSSLAVLPSLPKPLPHALHLLSSLPLLFNLLIRSQAIAHQAVEAKVKAGRSRLGAPPEKELRRNVEAEVLGGEMGIKMVDLLREVGAHPGVAEDVRRGVEIQEFGFWRKLVGALSYVLLIPPIGTNPMCRSGKESAPSTKPKPRTKPSPVQQSSTDLPLPALFTPQDHPKPTKQEALSRVDGLANGFVLLGIGGAGAEEGWSWVLEGKDEPTLCESCHYHTVSWIMLTRIVQSMISSSSTSLRRLFLHLLSRTLSTITAGGSRFLFQSPKMRPAL